MSATVCQITELSGYALRLLEHCGHGTIHSVYRKTINLSLDGSLIALQAAASPLSPLSLITTLSAGEMSALGAVAGKTVKIKDGAILLCSFAVFGYRDARCRELSLTQALEPASRTVLKQRIFSALSDRDAGSFELLFTNPKRADSVLFLCAARKRLALAEAALREARYADAAAALVGLLGLGLGLTPGGDDFLCGVLAGLILCGHQTHPFARLLGEEILRHLGDTNDISAAFLRCALEGEFSLAVNSLTALPSARNILSAFSEIGHSSGTDTLCGIYFILRCDPLLCSYLSSRSR